MSRLTSPPPTDSTPPRELLLAIDASHPRGSVALVEREQNSLQPRVVASQTLPAAERTARSLGRVVKELWDQLRLQPSPLSAVAVTVGPGSFTGLRIGVTMAKTLAYAAQVPVVGVNTLGVLLAQAPFDQAPFEEMTGETSQRRPSQRRLWAVINAQRGDLFVACSHDLPAGDLSQVGKSTEIPTQLLSASEWLKLLRPQDGIVGDAAQRYADQFPEGVTLLEGDYGLPTAATVGRLACSLLAHGQQISPFELLPRYYRASAAEEKAKQQSTTLQ